MKVEVVISKQARERVKKDKYIKNNKNFYANEIKMILLSQGNRPCETIGKFIVSPRGNKKIRIAWHFAYDFKADTKIIYIDDLLYHTTAYFYVDKWNEKASEGLISLNSYSDYVPWAGF